MPRISRAYDQFSFIKRTLTQAMGPHDEVLKTLWGYVDESCRFFVYGAEERLLKNAFGILWNHHLYKIERLVRRRTLWVEFQTIPDLSSPRYEPSPLLKSIQSDISPELPLSLKNAIYFGSFENPDASLITSPAIALRITDCPHDDLYHIVCEILGGFKLAGQVRRVVEGNFFKKGIFKYTGGKSIPPVITHVYQLKIFKN